VHRRELGLDVGPQLLLAFTPGKFHNTIMYCTVIPPSSAAEPVKEERI
jgi:hypothetical protein